MDNILVRIAIRRFLEHILTCVIVSVLITFLNVSEVLVTDIALGIGLSVCFIIYTVENIRSLRGCYRDLEDDMKYVLVNVAAYILFAIVTIAVYLLASNEIFVWLFAITKFVKFIGVSVDTFISMLLFHSIGFLSIFVAPVGVQWVPKDIDEDIEFMEE